MAGTFFPADPERLKREVDELLAAAASGDQGAWDVLVLRHNGLLWSIARSFRLDAADAADVVQMTWLKLVEHVDRITEPERLPAWLATTARRECLQLLRRGARDQRVDRGEPMLEPTDPAPEVDDALLRKERNAALWAAVGRLTERCQRLLRVLTAEPPPAYVEVAAALDMPVGSIGPARQRCLAQLRQVIRADPMFAHWQPEGERS